MLATASSQAIQSRPSVTSFGSRFGHLFLKESVRSTLPSVAQDGRFWGTLPCPSDWEGREEGVCGDSCRITLFSLRVRSCFRVFALGVSWENACMFIRVSVLR